MAMGSAAAARRRLAVVIALAALLPLAHAAMTPPASGVVVVRPWVARLQSLHDLSVSLGAGEPQPQQQGGLADCWGALMGLSSCSSEILLFFVNGESYIGPECCVAIRGATRFCWPAMLASVGFTAEEADVLRGFCDGEAALGAPPPVPAPGEPGRRT